jgi:hypothetical protein
VVREGVGVGGRNEPSLYAHMNNKRKMKKKKKERLGKQRASNMGEGGKNYVFENVPSAIMLVSISLL